MDSNKQFSTKKIKKADLVELKSFSNPPVLVKTTLTALCELLQTPAKNWKEVQKLLGDMKFMRKLNQFDPDSINEQVLLKMEKYTSNPEFNVDVVKRNSASCAGIVEWILAQIAYAKSKSETKENEEQKVE